MKKHIFSLFLFLTLAAASAQALPMRDAVFRWTGDLGYQVYVHWKYDSSFAEVYTYPLTGMTKPDFKVYNPQGDRVIQEDVGFSEVQLQFIPSSLLLTGQDFYVIEDPGFYFRGNPDIPDSFELRLNYFTGPDNDIREEMFLDLGGSYVLTTPETGSTAALLACGMLGLAAVKKRRA